MEHAKNDNECCEFVLKNGQRCKNKKEDECERCAMHGANALKQSAEKKRLNMYKLAKYQGRVDELAEHDKVKSLRNEIGILRMLFEEKYNAAAAGGEHSLILCSGPLTDMLMKIEKLVSSCQRLENSLDNMLDKQQVKNIATRLMQSLSECVNELDLSPEVASALLEKVANKFLEDINVSKS